jgi:hypothetical protein
MHYMIMPTACVPALFAKAPAPSLRRLVQGLLMFHLESGRVVSHVVGRQGTEPLTTDGWSWGHHAAGPAGT